MTNEASVLEPGSAEMVSPIATSHNRTLLITNKHQYESVP